MILFTDLIMASLSFLNDYIKQNAQNRKECEAEFADHELAEKAIAFASEVNLIKFWATKAFHNIFITNILINQNLSLITFTFIILNNLIQSDFEFIGIPNWFKLLRYLIIRYSLNLFIFEFTSG